MFLLSIPEVNEYFASDRAKQCKPTDYAVANGAGAMESSNCWWWLRSPGNNQKSAAVVHNDGEIGEGGFGVTGDYSAVRPAMWIDLSE